MNATRLVSSGSVHTAGGITWVLREAGSSPGLMALLARPERALERPGAMLKHGDVVAVWRDDGVVIKRWRPRRLSSLLKDVFRPSHALRAFTNACRLEAAGIPTPRPMAAGNRTRYGIPVVSYLVMEEIAGAVDLAARQAAGGETIRQLARLLAALHEAGFRHRDLKPSNLLFDAAGHAYLIDLDGIRARGRVSDTEAARDLAKLARRMLELASMSPREAAVFLRAYCRLRTRCNCRAWWHAIRDRIVR